MDNKKYYGFMKSLKTSNIICIVLSVLFSLLTIIALVFAEVIGDYFLALILGFVACLNSLESTITAVLYKFLICKYGKPVADVPAYHVNVTQTRMQQPRTTSSSNNTQVEKIKRLKEMYDNGTLTEEEFEEMKKNVLLGK